MSGLWPWQAQAQRDLPKPEAARKQLGVTMRYILLLQVLVSQKESGSHIITIIKTRKTTT
jgi:hypothetical protein